MKFILNLASVIHPLNYLLHQDKEWEWDHECEQAFLEAKQAIASSEVLVHFNPKWPVVFAGDASAYGVGAVISHTMPDGSERPIAFCL